MKNVKCFNWCFVAPWALVSLALPAVRTHAAPGGAPQASISLGNSDAVLCYVHDNRWSVAKQVLDNTIDAATGQGSITWEVSASKDAGSPPAFAVHGGLSIINTGSAPARIGSIVVNLQKPNFPKRGSNASYVSIAADIADATHGDAATQAKIVAAGSQENVSTNGAWGISNYSISGAQGLFVETSGSGSLEFKDATDNTVFSLVPQPSIAPGASITLLFSATFQSAVLPPAATVMRVETLVSFSNAGARGGSGAVADNVDINGNGAIDPDEAHCRTVPSRQTLAALPAAPDEANASVVLGDVITSTGTVSTSNAASALPALTSGSGSWLITADVDAGAEGGSLCNAASLDGLAEEGTLGVIVGYANDDFGNPVIPNYASYACAPAAHAEASVCVDVSPPLPEPPAPGSFQDGDFCTYTQGKFQSHANNAVATFLQANFAMLAFQSPGVAGMLTIGDPADSSPDVAHDATWTQVTSLRQWLGGGGPSGPFSADTLNATSTSGGTLARQAATLAVSVALSGSANGQPAGLADLYYCKPGDALHGATVREILSAAFAALGRGQLPEGYTFSAMNALLDAINARAFDDCKVGSFALQNLKRTACE